MSEDVILTFDLGTTRLKVAAFRLDGSLCAQAARRNVDHSLDGEQWQSADRWWQDSIDCTHELFANAGLTPRQVKGISLSGRAGAAVFVDAGGSVICDPWSDLRHADELRELVAGRPRTEVATYGATLLAKARWLRIHSPRVAERVHHAMYAKDFLLFRLTGECITDPSSGPDGPWDDQLIRQSDVPKTILPHPALPWEIAGELRRDAAALLGLSPGIAVSVGAHDGICANTGAGSVFPGDYAITLGTHAVVRAVTDFIPDDALRFYGYPPDRHIIGGNALLAGRSLDWFLDNWFDAPEERRQALFSRLDEIAAGFEPGAGGVRFLPFLGGQIAPERRPSSRAAFFGMDMSTTRESMYRAVLEGASFALSRIFEQVVGWAGEPARIGVTGSGAASKTWTQLLADLTGRPLELTDNASEGRGAAIFCAMALGTYDSLGDAVRAMVRPSRTVIPDGARRSALQEILADWQALSDHLRPFDKRN